MTEKYENRRVRMTKNLMKEALLDLMNGYVPVDENSDDLTAHFKQLYIANGTVGMLCEWIRSDFPMSSEVIADMMYNISKRIAY